MAEAKKTEQTMERDMAKAEQSTLAALKKCKKVPIFIPIDPNNPDDVTVVGINGVIYSIPRGEQYEVPEPVYKVWKDSFDKTREAEKKMTVKRDKKLEVL